MRAQIGRDAVKVELCVVEVYGLELSCGRVLALCRKVIFSGSRQVHGDIRCLVASARSWFLAPEMERSGRRSFLFPSAASNMALDGPWKPTSGEAWECKGVEDDGS